MKHDKTGQFEISQSSLGSAVVRCQILGGHTVNRDVGYGVHSYINLKILGGHVPVCPPYRLKILTQKVDLLRKSATFLNFSWKSRNLSNRRGFESQLRELFFLVLNE